MEAFMALTYTRLLQFYKQFGKYYSHQFADFSARTGLSLGEVHILLFLVNNLALECRDIQCACGQRLLAGLTEEQIQQLSLLLETVLENGLAEEEFA